MSEWEARLQNLANVLTIGTGLAYGYFRYFGISQDSYSVVHPFEPFFHNAHVIFSPALIFACGLIWNDHVIKKWKSKKEKKKRSGLALMATLFPMVSSGYFVQVTTDDQWRKIWVVVHVMASVVWTGSYMVHLLIPHLTKLRKPQIKRAQR